MPTLHLSDQFIKTLKNPQKRTTYNDDHLIENNKLKKSGVKGLGLRVTPTGRKSFVYRYWYDGKSKRFTIGTYPTISLSEARKQAEKLHQEVSQGNDPHREKKERKEDKPITFKEAVESYKKHHLPTLKESTKADYEARITHLLKGEGKKKTTKSRGLDGSRYIKNIKRHEIIDMLREIGKDAPTQANRLQAILSGIFKQAMNREWVDSNIASGIKIKSNSKKKKDGKWENVAFSESEIRTLWNTFNEHNEPVGSYMKVVLLLGQRAGETRKMKWTDIDLESQTWRIPATDTKNSKPNLVPLPNTVMAILEEAKPWTSGEFVFESQKKRGQPIGSQQKAVQRIRKKCGVNSFNLHSLRTTFTTYSAQLGTPQHVVSQILNHKNGSGGSKITAIYNKYEYEEEKRKALSLWDQRLNSIINDKKPKILKMG
ncbi:tyrosine-type recombinase/integrase [Gracilimonas sp.]|uniref:tyrosine-type recombinase/integrase n=1 Tax=Gracilimonas sp. TaxID=1974203 RepID=UPI003D106B1B